MRACVRASVCACVYACVFCAACVSCCRYAHFDPLVTVAKGAQHCNSIIAWISAHTRAIFVPTPAVWPIKV